MRTLVLGGAGSGKSGLAEALCVQHGAPLSYIATMQPFGKDAQARIRRHHALRAGKGFETLECYTNLAGLPAVPHGTVLLEDLGNLAANTLFAPGKDSAGAGAGGAGITYAMQEILAGIEALEAACTHLVVVTNDVAADGVAYPTETEEYIRLLGEINQILAARFERVAEIVCGIPIWHKGGKG